MVTTVTTTIITAVTTIATAFFAVIAIITLIALAIQKEIASEIDSTRAQRLSRALNIAFFPMLLIFVTILITKIVDVVH